MFFIIFYCKKLSNFKARPDTNKYAKSVSTKRPIKPTKTLIHLCLKTIWYS